MGANRLWATYLADGATPRWVPAAVARAFAAAHGNGLTFAGRPSQVRINAADQTLATDGGEALGACFESPFAGGGHTVSRGGDAPGDLTGCLAELMSVAIASPPVARHAFQQLALLWREYLTLRDLPTRSDFEAALVRDVIVVLHPGLPPTMDGNKLLRMADSGKIPTLHDLIDLLYAGIRDMQRRR